MDVKDIIKVIVDIGQVADYYGILDLGPCLTGHESKGTNGKQPFNIDLKFNRPLLTIRE